MNSGSETRPPLPDLSATIVDFLQEFRSGLESALRDSLASLYVFGALAFPRPDPWLLDVDFHVLLNRRITHGERVAVRNLHAELASGSPLGADLDGYYILLDDATRSNAPTSQVSVVQDNAWPLHRAHVLAGRFFLLTGMDPRSILPPPTWPELEMAIDAEVDFIRGHPEDAAYGILNGCRVLYSLRHRQVVVSKYEAAHWALRELPPEWAQAIAAALRFYTQRADEEDRQLLRRRHPEFLGFLGAMSR